MAEELPKQTQKSKLVISVKEARKILGKELSDKMTDDDLIGLIGMFTSLSDMLLEQFSVRQNGKVEV